MQWNLDGKQYPLKLGYVGVVCRSQQDIQESKKMTEAVKAEAVYFQRHPVYSKIKERCGIKFLSERLNKILMSHIMETIPSLKNNVTALLHARIAELKTYGLDIQGGDKGNLSGLLLYMISKFVDYYQTTIEGSFVQESTKELKGGARIHYIFHMIFSRALEQITALDGLTDEDIRTAIMNAKSLHPSLFIPEAAFENLIRQQIGKLLDPSLQCMNMVYDELKKIITNPEFPEILRFSKLVSKITEIMGELLHQCIGPSEEMIRDLIKIEDAYINVNHPDVLSGTSAILGLMPNEQAQPKDPFEKKEDEAKIKEEAKKKDDPNKDKGEPKGILSHFGLFRSTPKEEDKKEQAKEAMDVMKKGRVQNQFNMKDAGFLYMKALPEGMRADNPASSREMLETEIIKQLLESYFSVVKKNVTDMVPKTIMAFLVNKSKFQAQNKLVASLYSAENVEALMEENPLVLEKRSECKKMVQVLQDSLKALNDISEAEF
jgi:dynamin 1-like protein